jgi:hypothetical protein
LTVPEFTGLWNTPPTVTKKVVGVFVPFFVRRFARSPTGAPRTPDA